jgi:hypothetical protein
MNHKYYGMGMALVTIFAMFGANIQVLLLPKEYDFLMLVLLGVATGIFFVELLLCSVIKKGKDELPCLQFILKLHFQDFVVHSCGGWTSLHRCPCCSPSLH